MPYLEKRDGKHTGIHVGQVYKDGKKFKRSFKTHRDAEDYETFVRLMGREPPTIEEGLQGTGAPKFREAVEMAKGMKGPEGKWDLGTDNTLCQRLAFVDGVLGEYEITQIGEDQIDRLRARLDLLRKGKRPIKDSTKNRYLTVFSGVLHCCVIKKWLQIKPEVRLYPEDNALRAILTHEDQDVAILRLMREAGHTREAMCVEFLVETGLRRGELCGNRKKGPLQPHQITVDVDADGLETGWVNLGGADGEQTKNNSTRRVYVRADLAKEIRALIAGDQLPDGVQLLRHFKSAVKRAGLPKSLVIHSLRHTRNTRLRASGAEMKLRMKMLGHKSVATSMRYDHITDDDQLEAAKKLEERAGLRARKGDKGQVVAFPKVS